MKDSDLFAETLILLASEAFIVDMWPTARSMRAAVWDSQRCKYASAANRSSTSQRIAKWGVFMGLCECSQVIHSHLASCYSQIFSDLTPLVAPRPVARILEKMLLSDYPRRLVNCFRSLPPGSSSPAGISASRRWFSKCQRLHSSTWRLAKGTRRWESLQAVGCKRGNPPRLFRKQPEAIP
jgi:hypothetical protein